jgi:tRNA(Ile)-lysidine synthase TilS/MesJ
MNVTVIRPMIYMPEKDVRYFASKINLPIMASLCPEDGNTEREEMKKLLASLEKENKGLRYRIFGAIQRGGIDGYREISKMQGIKAYEEESEE